MPRPVSLQACLNGARSPAEHPALPLTPAALAAAAVAAVGAGADGLHVHPKDGAGADTLDPDVVAATVTALRDALPADLEIGLTTGLWAMPDAAARHAAVAAWPVLPDVVSVNWHEEGAQALIELLRSRGVGIEAGLWTVEVARDFLASAGGEQVTRVLVEAPEDGVAALGTAAEIVDLLSSAGVPAPLLVHGQDGGAWPVLRWAAGAGHLVRIGLEDSLVLPDGSPAPDSAALVSAAAGVIDR